MTRLLILLSLLSACYETDAPASPDAGESPDAAVDSDAGPLGDAGVDSGFPPAVCDGEPGTRLEVPSSVTGVISGFDRMGAAEGAQCWGTEGGEAHYQLHIERRQGVIIRIEGDRTALALRRGCTAASEFACAHPSSGFLQVILDPGDYELLLDTWSPETYAFTLTIEAFEAAPNSECDGAVEIPASGLTDQDPTFGGTGGADLCAASSWPELYYYVDVPPRTAIDIRATTTSPGDWRAGLRLQNQCRETSEPCEYYTFGTIRDDASFANSADVTDRLVVIGSTSATDPTLGRFDLSYELTPIAAHGACEAAMRWTGARRTESGRDAGQRLGAPGFVPDRTYYYAVELPPRTKARATATPIESDGGSTWVRASFLRGCGDTAIAEAVNETDSPETWIVEASFSVADPPRAFELALERIALAENTTCSRAAVLAPGARGDHELGIGGAAESACATGGTELWFETTVPAGQSVDVTATLTDFEGTYPYPVIRLVSACGGPCEQFGDVSAGAPRPAIVTLTNDGASARTFLYAVSILDLTGVRDRGSFRLDASVPR
jgi:hypothetical protein